MAILEAYELAKACGTKQILQPLTCTLEAGRVAGLFGPNGAGKSAFLRLLAGHTRPTGGVVAVGGVPLSGTPPHTVAYRPQRPTLLPWLRTEQMIDWYAHFYDGFDLVRAEFLCERLGIDPSQRIKTMGEAQTHMLATALTLCRRASLYLLDDPFAGIDPAMCARLQELIRASLREDCAILVTTHTLAETESLYDEALFLRGSTLVEHTTLAAIQATGATLAEHYGRVVGT